MDTQQIFYKDNPNLEIKIVSTYKGEREYRTNCKKIQGEYYIIGVDCFEVDDKWYRKDGGLIIYDYAKKKWVTKANAKNMIVGIVDYDGDGNPVMGNFTPDLCTNVTVFDHAITGKASVCISAEVALKACVEDVSRGNYAWGLKGSSRLGMSKIKNAVDNKRKGYNIEDNVDEMELKIKEYNKFPTRIKKCVARYALLLGDITFGTELECIRGYLPDHIQYQTGVVVCRDGSLHDADGSQGPEFTTIPLQGSKGVQSLINLCKALSTRTHIDKRCALHIHLGNLPTSRVFLVALYKLCVSIQDEMFLMFPYYKHNEVEYAGKDKNYCKKLNKLSTFALSKTATRDRYEDYIYDNYTKMFAWLASGVVPSKKWNRKIGNHPKGGEKWTKLARYCWVNFMNVIFSRRNTVEFRIHQGTTNPQKVVTWLFMCNAIVKTAMAKTADILKGDTFTLSDVMDYYKTTFKVEMGTQMTDYLKYYVEQRTAYFNKDFKKGDYMSENELVEDKDFALHFPGISDMFK